MLGLPNALIEIVAELPPREMVIVPSFKADPFRSREPRVGLKFEPLMFRLPPTASVMFLYSLEETTFSAPFIVQEPDVPQLQALPESVNP